MEHCPFAVGLRDALEDRFDAALVDDYVISSSSEVDTIRKGIMYAAPSSGPITYPKTPLMFDWTGDELRFYEGFSAFNAGVNAEENMNIDLRRR